jgi:hypothetical protein
MTTANLRPIDQARAGRLLLGWLRGDKLAIDTAVNEAAHDPIGTPGILFAMTTLSAELAVLIAPDNAEQQIEQALRRIAGDHPQDGGSHE